MKQYVKAENIENTKKKEDANKRIKDLLKEMGVWPRLRPFDIKDFDIYIVNRPEPKEVKFNDKEEPEGRHSTLEEVKEAIKQDLGIEKEQIEEFEEKFRKFTLKEETDKPMQPHLMEFGPYLLPQFLLIILGIAVFLGYNISPEFVPGVFKGIITGILGRNILGISFKLLSTYLIGGSLVLSAYAFLAKYILRGDGNTFDENLGLHRWLNLASRLLRLSLIAAAVFALLPSGVSDIGRHLFIGLAGIMVFEIAKKISNAILSVKSIGEKYHSGIGQIEKSPSDKGRNLVSAASLLRRAAYGIFIGYAAWGLISLPIPAGDIITASLKMLILGVLLLEGISTFYNRRSILWQTIKFYLRPPADWGGVGVFIYYLIQWSVFIGGSVFLGFHISRWFGAVFSNVSTWQFVVAGLGLLNVLYITKCGIRHLMTIAASSVANFPVSISAFLGAAILVLSHFGKLPAVVPLVMIMLFSGLLLMSNRQVGVSAIFSSGAAVFILGRLGMLSGSWVLTASAFMFSLAVSI
ncbi:MAG TPA: hypothetical protein ENN78_00325, partial [Candidatus Omnitrophica bacterium]|nr:hypothetical protein [Candidatus Omnitrophota bacterium]